MNPTVLLTFDVEDWFQVENFKQCIPFSAWPNCELRVEKNVHRILDLLDSIKLNNPINASNPSNSSNSTNSSREMQSLFHCDSTNPMDSSNPINPSNPMNPNNQTNPINPINSSNPSNSTNPINPINSANLKATFFVLGWIARRLPQLIREIQNRGHEVASHGYGHTLCREQAVKDLKNDLAKSKRLLEDITGAGIDGYRAPGFSISRDILRLIEETGYLYDSSYNSFRLNKRYGQIELQGNNRNGILHKISDSFYEIPISNLRIGKQVFPWGGGGYFRLMPLQLFKHGIQSILKSNGIYVFYMHPWEIDPDQPRMSDISRPLRFRHYVNIDKTCSKLSMLLKSFKQYHFSTCIQYIIDETQRTQQTQ